MNFQGVQISSKEQRLY